MRRPRRKRSNHPCEDELRMTETKTNATETKSVGAFMGVIIQASG